MRKDILLAIGGFAVFPMAAQSVAGGEMTQSFEEFRAGVLEDFENYRGKVLDHYADFLEGTWHDHVALEGEKRNSTPKPKGAPEISKLPATPIVQIPTPSIPDGGVKNPADAPTKRLPGNLAGVPAGMGKLPKGMNIPAPRKPVLQNPELPTPGPDPISVDTPAADAPAVETPVVESPIVETPMVETPMVEVPIPEVPVAEVPIVETPVDETPVAKTPVIEIPVIEIPEVAEIPEVSIPKVEIPVVIPAPVAVVVPEVKANPEVNIPETKVPEIAKKPSVDKVDFYGMEIPVEKINVKLASSAETPQEMAAQWRDLDSQGMKKKLVGALSAVSETMGLNDYLKFRLVESYFNTLAPNSDENVKMAAIHYVLANMGLDVRLGRANSRHTVLMMPFTEKIYENKFLNLDGKRYYVYGGEGYSKLGQTGVSVATCDLPTNSQKGDVLEIKITDLRLPRKDHPYDIKQGALHLQGVMNGNLIPVLRHYPLLDMAPYALSVVDPAMRADLVAQVKEQLGSQPQRAGVDALLRFIQRGFDYATDQEYHGYEKPYFLEETLYYDKCDCEDRAIFYTYLLWNALGVENQLLTYPGHESASVCLDDQINGTSYQYNGKTFYISDPTYIGSRTGQCMPDFTQETPVVEYHYSH